MDVAGRCRMTGLAVGAGLAFPLTRTYLFDLAPVALALSVILGVLIGDLTTPRPARARGTASLRARRVREYLPTGTLVAVGLMGLAIGLFWLYPTPDRPSAEIKYFGDAEPVTLTTTLATLAGIAALAALTTWAVVRSPQAGVDESQRLADERWRHATVHTIVHTCAALYAAVFTAVAFWYANAQLDWRGGGSVAVGFVLSLIAGAGLVIFVRNAAALTKSPRAERTPQPSDDDTFHEAAA